MDATHETMPTHSTMNKIPPTLTMRRKRTMRGIVLGGRLIDRRIRRKWKNYLFQCGISTLALMLILLVLDVVLEAAIVVAIASTAFIIFVMPHSAASHPRRVVGGHLVGVIVGWCSTMFLTLLGEDIASQSRIVLNITAAASVGISIFIMVVTDTNHPPAAGTALGLAIGEGTFTTILFILAGTILLSTVHMILRPRLTNLL